MRSTPEGFVIVWVAGPARGVHELTAIHGVQNVANLELPIGRPARAYARDDVKPGICTAAGRGHAGPAGARAGASRPLAPGKRGTATTPQRDGHTCKFFKGHAQSDEAVPPAEPEVGAKSAPAPATTRRCPGSRQRRVCGEPDHPWGSRGAGACARTSLRSLGAA